MENDDLKGWWFDVVETSNYVYRVTGSDQHRHEVSRHGTDVDVEKLLRECHADARDIQRQVEEKRRERKEK